MTEHGVGLSGDREVHVARISGAGQSRLRYASASAGLIVVPPSACAAHRTVPSATAPLRRAFSQTAAVPANGHPLVRHHFEATTGVDTVALPCMLITPHPAARRLLPPGPSPPPRWRGLRPKVGGARTES